MPATLICTPGRISTRLSNAMGCWLAVDTTAPINSVNDVGDGAKVSRNVRPLEG